jgi:hypothetical protein
LSISGHKKEEFEVPDGPNGSPKQVDKLSIHYPGR